MNTSRFAKFCFLFPLLGAALIALFGAIVMWLWNAVLPVVTNVQPLNFWQAIGLLVLCKILFGGFWGRRCGPGGPPWRRGGSDAARWCAMTPDQRAEMREEMRRRFGEWPSPERGGDQPTTGTPP
jgi:hypothetical protein